MEKLANIHPGEILNEEFLLPLKWVLRFFNKYKSLNLIF